MNFGPYAAYIWSAYALAGLALLGLFAATLIDLLRQKRTLAKLEEKRRD